MIGKAVSVPRDKVGKPFGRINERTMHAVSRSLVAFLGLEGAA
jgi:hypothetical protein